MRHTMDEVRIGLDQANMYLRWLGIDKKLRISTTRDGGGNCRRLACGYEDIGYRSSINGLYDQLEAVTNVLKLVYYETKDE